jgi:hypothetical protein
MKMGKLAKRIDELPPISIPLPSVNGKHEEPKKVRPQRPAMITGAELERKVFPRPALIVEDLLVEGLTLFCGNPKSGKSYTALNLALAVATGEPALGSLQTE